MACRPLVSPPQQSAIPKKMQWTGSPYVEWEVSTFLNPLRILRVFPDGILALEGTFRDGLFEAEKSVLLDLTGERVLWRTSIALELKNPGQTFSAVVFRLPAAPGQASRLLNWVKRDVLRVQDFLTGEDVWNRPGCRFPVPVPSGRIAAVCFGRLSLVDSATGRVQASRPLDFTPAGLWFFDGRYLFLDERQNLHLLSMSDRRETPMPTPENLERVFVNERHLMLVSRARDAYVMQSVRLDGTGWKLDWKLRLDRLSPTFWVHVFQDRVIFPLGFDCIGARGVAQGEEAWISCGLDETNPPAHDEDGLFMLSSRSESGHRPVIYVDGFNGLQTPLFRNAPNQEVVPFLAMTLAPGPVVNGVLYGVHSSSKLFALRVAAPPGDTPR